MISFSLCCAKEHRFDSWFASSAAFDALLGAGRISCPNCGDNTITKALMAPAVAVTTKVDLAALKSDAQTELEQMRRHIEENADYVGNDFAHEARRIHDGDAPARAIYGEASAAQARALLSDGVPVAPLPFLPRTKVN
jgi:hypothetical protein